MEWIDSEAKILDRTKRSIVPGGVEFSIEFDEYGTFNGTLAGSLSRNLLANWVAAVKAEYFARKESQAPEGFVPPPPAPSDNGGESSAPTERSAGVLGVAEPVPADEASLYEVFVKQERAINERLAAALVRLTELTEQRDIEIARAKAAQRELRIVRSVIEDAQEVHRQNRPDIREQEEGGGEGSSGGVCEPATGGDLSGGDRGPAEESEAVLSSN